MLILWNRGHVFRDHLWIRFIDVEGALACLAKGSSSFFSSGEIIIGITHKLAAILGMLSWCDRVGSASNPVDKLTRHDMKGPWKLVRIGFPNDLLQRIARSEDVASFSQGVEFQRRPCSSCT